MITFALLFAAPCEYLTERGSSIRLAFILSLPLFLLCLRFVSEAEARKRDLVFPRHRDRHMRALLLQKIRYHFCIFERLLLNIERLDPGACPRSILQSSRSHLRLGLRILLCFGLELRLLLLFLQLLFVLALERRLLLLSLLLGLEEALKARLL